MLLQRKWRETKSPSSWFGHTVNKLNSIYQFQSPSSFFVGVHEFVCACVCLCVFVQICVCKWKPEDNLEC